jgi:hypothetical protein
VPQSCLGKKQSRLLEKKMYVHLQRVQLIKSVFIFLARML